MTRRDWINLLFFATAQTDQLDQAHQEFLEAYNGWVRYAVALSPASPNLLEKLRQQWRRRRVAEKFRRVEQELEG